MSRFRILTIAGLVALAIVVVLQNTTTVEVRFLLVTLQTPRAVLISVSLLVGFCVGLLVAARSKRSP